MLSEKEIEEIYNRVIECNSIYHKIDKACLLQLLIKSEYYKGGVYPNIDIESVKKDMIIESCSGRKYLVKKRSDGGLFWYSIQTKT